MCFAVTAFYTPERPDPILNFERLSKILASLVGGGGGFFAQHRLRRADQQYKGLVGQAAAGKEGLLTSIIE